MKELELIDMEQEGQRLSCLDDTTPFIDYKDQQLRSFELSRHHYLFLLQPTATPSWSIINDHEPQWFDIISPIVKEIRDRHFETVLQEELLDIQRVLHVGGNQNALIEKMILNTFKTPIAKRIRPEGEIDKRTLTQYLFFNDIVPPNKMVQLKQLFQDELEFFICLSIFWFSRFRSFKKRHLRKRKAAFEEMD